jgi:tetratricopeptide (TPR) repeat protein
MTESLYERYRDALRGGHLAALKGHRPIAVRAYLEAAALLPDRAAPYLGLGRIELDDGRATESLAAFAAALERAPNETAALDGSARALVALDRRTEAADVLDRLAITLLEIGREAEARTALERAVELAESRWRRRALKRLRTETPLGDESWIGELPAGEAAAADRGAVPVSSPLPERPPSMTSGPDLRRLAERVEAASAAGDVDELLRGALALARADRLRAAIDACHDALSVAPDEPAIHRALASIYRRRGWEGVARAKLALVERYLAVVDDSAELDRLADQAEAAGDLHGLLAVARRHARQRRYAAALEAAFRALSLAPADPRVHLAIASIHLSLGWRRRAMASVARLWQLVELTENREGRELVAAFAADELQLGNESVIQPA